MVRHIDHIGRKSQNGFSGGKWPNSFVLAENERVSVFSANVTFLCLNILFFILNVKFEVRFFIWSNILTPPPVFIIFFNSIYRIYKHTTFLGIQSVSTFKIWKGMWQVTTKLQQRGTNMTLSLHLTLLNKMNWINLRKVCDSFNNKEIIVMKQDSHHILEREVMQNQGYIEH